MARTPKVPTRKAQPAPDVSSTAARLVELRRLHADAMYHAAKGDIDGNRLAFGLAKIIKGLEAQMAAEDDLDDEVFDRPTLH